MGNELYKLNHDDVRAQFEGGIILNDLLPRTREERQNLDMNTYVELVGDSMDMTPSCGCGFLKGGINIGVMCPKCATKVESHRSEAIEPICWFRAPQGVAGLINPMTLITMRWIFRRGDFCAIDWLIRPAMPVTRQSEVIRQQILDSGIKRGYNYLVENLVEVVSKLSLLKAFRSSRDRSAALLSELQLYPDRVVSQYMPLLNRSLMVVEANLNDKYVDPIVIEGIEAIRAVTGIDHPDSGLTEQMRENRTASAVLTFSDFYTDLIRSVLGKKPGWIRRHLGGTRSHFTLRAVISSITEPHQYDELHLPWSGSVVLFALHLTNLLVQRHGMTAVEAKNRLNEAISNYDPLIDKLFQTLLSEGIHGRMWATIGRNPTLQQASLQLYGIGKIKTDLSDDTISLPITTTPGFNADFDGDQMSVTLITDAHMLALAWPLRPHNCLPNINNDLEFSNVMTMPKPVVATTCGFLGSIPEFLNPEQEAFMASLE